MDTRRFLLNKNVLDQLANHQITPKKAYKKLFLNQPTIKPKVRFMKLRIQIKEQMMLSMFLNVLFFLPFPIFLLKIGKRFVPKEYLFAFDALDYAKGTIVDIESSEANIYIKLF